MEAPMNAAPPKIKLPAEQAAYWREQKRKRTVLDWKLLLHELSEEQREVVQRYTFKTRNKGGYRRNRRRFKRVYKKGWRRRYRKGKKTGYRKRRRYY